MNDAEIIAHILETEKEFTILLEDGYALIVDRGFQSAIDASKKIQTKSNDAHIFSSRSKAIHG